MPSIKAIWHDFEAALVRLLEKKDPRAPARMVFYPVVQVGGFIPLDSALGRAAKSTVKDEIRPFIDKQGKEHYFAADLYLWWEQHESEFVPFGQFDEWRKRPFGRDTVIPGYRKMASQSTKPHLSR
jgi:hypothetical protein